jgi:hypothetical protein
MPALLTTATIMKCPHKGTVMVTCENARVTFDGDFALRETDTFTIVDCTFSTTAGPHPCLSVTWSSPAERSTVLGDSTLTESSVGSCIAADEAVQGTVEISGVQDRVAGE